MALSEQTMGDVQELLLRFSEVPNRPTFLADLLMAAPSAARNAWVAFVRAQLSAQRTAQNRPIAAAEATMDAVARELATITVR